MTGDDGAIGIGHAARDQTREKRFAALFGVRRRKWPGAMPVPGQVRDVHAQVLLREAAREEGHDFLVRSEAGKKNYSSLRHTVSFFEDSGFQAATARWNEKGLFLVGLRKCQPETRGAKKDSAEGACGFS